MTDKAAAAFRRRATQVRKIAEGIFDKAERKIVLNFVDDCETLAATPKLRRVKAKK